jgi:glyoxylase-like metal-dependent hydrolase (beta-lactamase superfamily II)
MSIFRPPSRFAVAPGVSGLRTVMVNVYYIASADDPQKWVLVDGGLRGTGPRIHAEAERLFGQGNPPLAIVLTHGHFDHVGGLPWLLSRWRCPVYAHLYELPFINGHRAYPPPDPSVGGGLLARGSLLYPRHAARLPQHVQLLPLKCSVPGLPEWRWIETPGHSPGHVSFFREADRLLIAGDALVTTRQESVGAVWHQTKELRPPPAYFTPDWGVSYHSIEDLLALKPRIVASGHGLPLSGPELSRELDRLVAHFEEIGLPAHGRYVARTWHPHAA